MSVSISAARGRVSVEVPRLAPGLAVAGLVGLAAVAVEATERAAFGQAIVEALVAAILVGMLVRNMVRVPAEVDLGAAYAAKQLLEVAVLLLGATIDLRQVLAAGPVLLVAIAVGVCGGIGVSYSLGRLIGLSDKLALLVAVGNSICGNSAIAAVAPVIRAGKKDVASSIALTAVVGVVVILTLPLLVPLAHLTFYQYGVLAGMSVYAVPQVVAASFPVSPLSGQVATLVKLVRVLFLGPVVLLFGLLMRRQADGAVSGMRPAYVPWFITGFIALAALRSAGLVPETGLVAAQQVSHGLMILAMAGLGLGVEFAALRKVGPRVLVAVAGSLAFLISLSLGLILGLHIVG